MNERKQSSLSGNNGETDMPSGAPDPARTGATLVFAGDPSQVSAGFALALRLMGLDAPLPDVSARDQSGEEEDRDA